MKTTLSALALGLVLALGFGGLWGAAVLHVYHPALSLRPDNYDDYLYVRADGTPVIERRRYPGGNSVVSDGYLDLRGRPLTVAPDAPWAAGVFLGAGRTDELAPALWPTEESWEWRERTFEDQRYPDVAWHLVSDGKLHGRAYLVGYDKRTAVRLGFLGTAGFRPDELPAEQQFPFSYMNPVMLSHEAAFRLGWP
jgi:hypothetical protein